MVFSNTSLFIKIIDYFHSINYLFSNQLLMILGKNYSNLNYELILNIIGNSIGILAGVTFSLYTAKGWAILPYVYVPINITAIILGILIFKVNTIQGVLYLTIFTAFVQYVMNLIFLFVKIINDN